ncbi:Unknown protein [Striga hermonthica]|uniref:DUF8040 domain-containing protein n=1 Tax=Striga hermonthica TaxID=68872 RepID=A0A9N7N818_STRHE|nr:Unknown protein [Striga hermonthica]
MPTVLYRQSTYTGADRVNELLTGHDRRFYDAMGLNKYVFKLLCKEIKQTGCHGDERQKKVRIQESVAIFLYTDCIGAIDGTIYIPKEDHVKYRCRKGYLAQNVMVACDFDCKFTFVFAG